MDTLLVANRGEIARRVFTTARRMGLGTVAVFSDPDASSLHVAEADVAIRLPGASASRTYLRGDAVIAAAVAAGADAVHPGYGFLSENAAFARDVLDAGLCWVGPPAKAIESMGAKVTAKRLMAAAGVPVLASLDPAAVTAKDLPVLIKASAGGGGRGMRVARSLSELAGLLQSASREAESAFGDPTVFCERYLPDAHHVEVQVLADAHGTVWAVGERECSVQRRYQKVIEEAPSPLVSRVPGMRERLFSAARAAAMSIRYVGAGTVEFLASASGEFFFLEMNTRLQVEHPVTENTTGLDLVRWQLLIADGAALPGPDEPATCGHSIEARLYAEDALFRPQAGTLISLSVPGADVSFAPLTSVGVRVDSGVSSGSAVSPYYDPLLAKVISVGASRAEAARLLSSTLARARIHGLVTNRDLLVRVLRDETFLAGDADTSFLATHDLGSPLADQRALRLSAVAAALATAAANRVATAAAVGLPPGVGLPAGWRNLPSQPQSKSYACTAPVSSASSDSAPASGASDPGSPAVITVGYVATHDGISIVDEPDLTVVEATPGLVVLEVPGSVQLRFEVAAYGDLVCVDSAHWSVQFTSLPRFTEPADAAVTGSLRAPMPGVVTRIAAEPGGPVVAGEPLMWLEAMKMEHTIAAPATGVLARLHVKAGEQVSAGSLLAVIDAATASGPATEGDP